MKSVRVSQWLFLVTVVAGLNTACASSNLARGVSPNEAETMSLLELLTTQPDFQAIETTSVWSEITRSYKVSAKLTKRGNTYRRDRGSVITYSTPGRELMISYPRSKEYIEEPSVGPWYLGAEDASIFVKLRGKDLDLRSAGTETVGGYECTRIKATLKSAVGGQTEEGTVLFCISMKLRNLSLKTEVVTPRVRIQTLLKDVSLTATNEAIVLPFDYKKVLADPTAEYRFVDYFRLSTLEQFTVESARSELLERLPRGSSEVGVYNFLEESGIGRDGLSSYYPKDGSGEIVCRIEYDPTLPGMVKKHFGVIFVLDGQNKLKDVEIHAWLTGT
jgi:hypothetical protein